MSGLDILIVGLGRRPRTELSERFARLGHEVTRSDQTAVDRATRPPWDVVVVDAAPRGVGRADVARIRSGYARPVLVVGERPACLTGIAGAMFCFADADDIGHDLALRICVALSPLNACESPPRSAALHICGATSRLVPVRRWQVNPARGRPAARRTQPR